MDIEKIRKDAELFTKELEEEYYQNLGGYKDELNLSAIYEKYSYLFRRSTVDSVKELRDRSEGEEKRQNSMLYSFIAEEYIRNLIKKLDEKYMAEDAKATVNVDGKDVPYRQISIMIGNEDSREKRSKMDALTDPVVEKHNEILKERMLKLHDLSVELGYGNYMEMAEDLKGFEIKPVRDMMERFLRDTEKVYVNSMNSALERFGITVDEAERHDISYLFRAKEFDRYFPKEGVVGNWKATMKGIGIDPDAQKNIILDTEERPKKYPRAFTMPLEVPDKVILFITPHGGQDDYQSMLHEGGHTQHYANIERAHPFEYKYLGDISVSETYAFIFNYLPTDPLWLKRYLNMGDSEIDRYLNFAFLNKLFFLRRYASKIIYETELHAKRDIDGMDTRYKEIMERGLKIRHKANRYLLDVDDGFYVAQYLRAWIFETQLRKHVIEKTQREWFNSKDAGKILKELWSYGQKYSVEELAKMIGYGGLDAEPMTDEIISALRG